MARKMILFGAAVGMMAALAAAPAFAATEQINFRDGNGNVIFPDGSDTFTVRSPSGITAGSGVSASVGGFGYSTFSPLPAGDNSTDLFWCDNLTSALASGTNTYQVTVISSGFAAAGSSNPLSTTAVNQLNALVSNGQTYLAAHVNSDVSAALRVAIWAVLYNGSSTWGSVTNTSNPFYISGANGTVVTDAQAFLACLTSTNSFCASQWAANSSFGLTDYSFSGSQSVLRLTSNFSQTAVPEPSSLALLGAGLLGLVMFRRRGANAA